MNLVFDAACLSDGPVTGVARSFLNGLEAYAEQYAKDMIVLVPEGASTNGLPDTRRAQIASGAWRRQRALPQVLHQLQADLLHSSVVSVPLRAHCPTIATVHDLPWLHRESGERSTWWRRFATKRALRAATAVIAPSKFTLDAAARILGHRNKLHHIPHITGAPTTISDPTLRTGPFLVLGDNRPRKNRARVREAHRLARQQNPQLPDIRFVGPPDDYVTEAEKVRLLGTCCAVVSCSLYEGFGMPVLEALVHGAPLICSDIPPHREIAGEAAVYVRELDARSIATAMNSCSVPPGSTRKEPTLPSTETRARLVSQWRDLHSDVSPDAPPR